MTVSSYTYFDWINGKCSYPTYTVWSHDQSGTDMIVDSIRDFTDKTTLYMHVQKNGRYLIPTSSGYTDFSRSEMSLSICSSFFFSSSTSLSIVFPAFTLLALPAT